jgi:hypothetical protein
MVRLASPVGVVVEIDALRLASAALPLEDQPPLLVDADRMKRRQIASQLLEMVAGRHAQVLIGCGVVEHLEPPKEAAFEIRRDVPRPHILNEEGSPPRIPKAQDHTAVPMCLYTTQRYKRQASIAHSLNRTRAGRYDRSGHLALARELPQWISSDEVMLWMFVAPIHQRACS